MRTKLVIILFAAFLVLLLSQPACSENTESTGKRFDGSTVQGPDFITVPAIRPQQSDSVYHDILAHSVEPPFGNAHGKSTNAHETGHGIHATYRNKYTRANKAPYNAFYCLDGQLAVIKEPEFLVRNVQQFIPAVARHNRYQLYFVEQLKYWDDRPLYVFDEWNAYILGAECALDQFFLTGENDHTDCVSGALEFSVFAVALYLTAQQRVPDYLEAEPQFKKFLAYNLLRAEFVFLAGKEIFPSSKQKALFEALQAHPELEPIRTCLREEFAGAFLLPQQ